jgi:pimeloyl-ACP methyl ester carboxylesterase
VAVCDHRDFGQSTRLPESAPRYTAVDVVDDAVAVLDALGWSSAHLFGHSLGGVVAQRIALRWPNRVRSLTSSASAPGTASRMRMLRYLRTGLFVRLARLRLPADVDDVVLGLAVARMLVSPGYPFDEDATLAVLRHERALGIADGFRNWPAQARALRANW